MGRGRVDALVVLLLGVWLLATPVLAYGAMITAAPFFGEQPTPAEQGSALRLALAAVGTGLGAPAAGLVVALAARRRRAAIATAVALGVTVLALVALLGASG